MKNKGITISDPCRRCGKIIRNDYDGFCMDCADSLGVSEFFEKRKKYRSNLKEANKQYPKI